MKKEFDLKLLENADRDTLEALSGKYTAVGSKEAEKIYRRIMKNTGDFDEEVQVQGVELYRGSIWKKALAAAVTLVIIAGAAGGAYHFAGLNKNRPDGISDNEAAANGSIYEKLRKNREYYNLDLALWDITKGESYSELDIDTEKFFDFMDSRGTAEELAPQDFSAGSRSVRLFFNDMYAEAGGVTYSFELFDNGTFTWKENDGGKERMTYHRFTDGSSSYEELMKIYLENLIIAEIENVTQEEQELLLRSELELLLRNGFDTRSANIAYFRPAGKDQSIGYTVSDTEGFRKALFGLEWERADSYSSENSYLLGSIGLNNEGGMQIIYKGKERNYKLKNNDQLDVFRTVIAKHLILNKFGTDASKEDILDAFNRDFGGKKAEFRTDSGQFTKGSAYIITNYSGLKNELADLEWVTCKTDEQLIYRDFYTAGAIISRNGYLKPQSGGVHRCAYKLKNESDTEKLREICDRYMVADMMSELTDKLRDSADSYENLKGTFSLSYQPGSTDFYINGTVECDNKNHELYLYGTGYELGCLDPRHDLTVETAVMGEKGVFSEGGFGFEYDSSDPYRYMLQYDRLYDGIIALSERYSREYGECRVSKEEQENGYTKYTLTCGNSYTGFTVIFDEKGRLISYELPNGYHFTLETYEFDSPYFVSSDIPAKYEDIKSRANEMQGVR